MKSQLLSSPARRWAFALALLACTASTLTPAQSNRGTAPRPPGGNYTVAYQPFMGPGYESLPVLVNSVTARAGEGITHFSVENASSQAVDAVRVRWYLSRAEKPGTFLNKGETPVLRIPGGIRPGTADRIKFSVTSFAAAIGPVLKTPTIAGNYLIQVAVSEVRFADGTWHQLVSER